MKVMIGIDVGKKTGFALSLGGKLSEVKSYGFWDAVTVVKSLFEGYKQDNQIDFKVYVEDPRLRTWFGSDEKKVQAARMGVGSVKRDAELWEEFLQREQIPYELIAPKYNRTKLSHEQFIRLTGWTNRTNEHGRDAAMLIYGRQ